MPIDQLNNGDTGLQARTIINALVSGSNSQPKVYKALLTQSGTDAPVATESVNTTSATITYVFDASGQYIGTLSSPILLAGKTHFNIQNGGIVSTDTQFEIQRINDSSFYVNSLSAGVLIDSLLSNTSVQIEIFP